MGRFDEMMDAIDQHVDRHIADPTNERGTLGDLHLGL